MATFPYRIVGSDIQTGRPRGPAPNIEGRVAGRFTNEAKGFFDQAQSSTMQAIGSMQESNRYRAQLSAETHQIRMQALEAQAQGARVAGAAAAQRQDSFAREAAGLINVINNVTETVQRRKIAEQKLQEQIARQLDRERKKVADEQYTEATDRVQTLVFNAPQVIKEKGIQGYRTSLFRIMDDFPGLLPEQQRAIITTAMAEAKTYNRQQIKTSVQKMEEMRDNRIAVINADMQLSIANDIAYLRNAPPTIDPSQYIQKIEQKIQGVIQNHPELNQAEALDIYRAGLESLVGAVGTNTNTRVQAENKIKGIDGFLTEQVFALREFYADGDIAKYNAAVQQLAVKYDVPGGIASEIGDPLAADRMASRVLKHRQELAELHRKGKLNELRARDYENAEVGNLVLQMQAQPGKVAVYERLGQESGAGVFIEAVEANKRYNEYLQAKPKIANQIAQLTGSLARFKRDSAQWLVEANVAVDGMSAFRRLKELEVEMLIPDPPVDTDGLAEWQKWTQEVEKSYQNRISNLRIQLTNMKRGLDTYGLDPDKDLQFQQETIQNKIQAQRDLVSKAAQLTKEKEVVRGTMPNFNRGSSSKESTQLKQTDYNGTPLALPLAFNATNYNNQPVYISSDFNKARVRSNGTTYLHSGLDIAVQQGENVIVPDGAVVIAAGWQNPKNKKEGWGKFVRVRLPDNTEHVFAHLDTINVRVGQVLPAFSVLGTVGNTGNSTGPHLHIEVIRNEQRMDPRAWYEARLNRHQAMRYRYKVEDYMPNYNPYSNQEPSVDDMRKLIPSNAIPLTRNAYIYDGKLRFFDGNNEVVEEDVPNNVSVPIKPSYSISTRNAWNGTNNPDSNFGYAHLSRYPSKSKKIVEVADRLNIPAQWLADVIAFESGFKVDVVNQIGATGLIQFMPETAKRLGTTTQQLSRMSFDKQMEYVYRYLEPFRNRFTTIAHLLGSIWSSPDILDMLDDPKRIKKALNRSDGQITFRGYLQRLGSGVGRQYKLSGITRQQRVANIRHTSLVNGCKVCQSILQAGSVFFPHEPA